MPDMSHLDQKYFIDEDVYNCPYCNRRNVQYEFMEANSFDWTIEKKCWVIFVRCSSCYNTSMHLSFTDIFKRNAYGHLIAFAIESDDHDIDIDDNIFHHVPSSSFILDDRIPKIIRDLISEAEGCLKMNFLTGASGCTRKAIYEFVSYENADGKDYQSRIKSLKAKYPQVDSQFFDILSHIQGMTSDKMHEKSWEKWDSESTRLFIRTIKEILKSIYVVPDDQKKTKSKIDKMYQDFLKKLDKKENT